MTSLHALTIVLSVLTFHPSHNPIPSYNPVIFLLEGPPVAPLSLLRRTRRRMESSSNWIGSVSDGMEGSCAVDDRGGCRARSMSWTAGLVQSAMVDVLLRAWAARRTWPVNMR